MKLNNSIKSERLHSGSVDLVYYANNPSQLPDESSLNNHLRSVVHTSLTLVLDDGINRYELEKGQRLGIFFDQYAEECVRVLSLSDSKLSTRLNCKLNSQLRKQLVAYRLILVKNLHFMEDNKMLKKRLDWKAIDLVYPGASSVTYDINVDTNEPSLQMALQAAIAKTKDKIKIAAITKMFS